MSRQLKLIIFANLVLVLLFGIMSWVEYSLLSTPIGYNPSIIFEGGLIQAKETVVYSYALLTFLASTILNLYFIIRLQKSKEKQTEPNP